MRIRTLLVEGFKNLEVKMNSWEVMTILLGPNGIGKSNVIEILESAFRFVLPTFPSDMGRNLGRREGIWHRYSNDGDPIRVGIIMDLIGEEMESIFPKLNQVQTTHLLEVGFDLELINNNVWVRPERFILAPFGQLIDEGGKLISDQQVSFDPIVRKNQAWAIVSAVVKYLAKTFHVIRTENRSPGQPQFGVRKPAVAQNLITSLVQMGTFNNPRTRQALLVPFRNHLTMVFPELKGISAPASNLFLSSEDDLEIPFNDSAGGYQSVAAILISWLHIKEISKNAVIAIEEPEVHLHPLAQKRLVRSLAQIATENQLLVTTHSPFIIDRAALDQLWVARQKDGVTSFLNVGRSIKDDMAQIMYSIGVRPSDLMFADSIILVEGLHDKDFFGRAGELLGLTDLTRASMIPIDGAGNAKRKVLHWAGLTRDTAIPTFIILDGDMSDEINDLVSRDLVPAERAANLPRSCVEEYYPPHLVTRALNEIHGIDEDNIEVNDGSIYKDIEKTLGSAGLSTRFWKADVNRYVVAHLVVNDIHPDVQLILSDFDRLIREFFEGPSSTTA